MTIGFELGMGCLQRRAGSAVATPAFPPADWRMPAAVTCSSGLSSAQAALAAAQDGAASKARPSFIVAAGATEWVEWDVAASASPLLLSFVGASTIGTAAVSVGGVDAGFIERYPAGSDVAGSGYNKPGRRQFALIPAGGARTVRLTIAAGAAPRTIHPLLHQLPASGPADAHVVLGASREDQGMASRFVEDAVLAAFPTRDPVVFDYAKSSATVDDIAAFASEVATIYAGVASYALVGSTLGNAWSLPYTGGQQASLSAKHGLIVSRLKTAGFATFASGMTFRTTNGTTPASQDSGSKPFNDNIIFPNIASELPDGYDPALLRARWDAYGLTMRHRALLADDRHGSPAMYDQEVAFLVDQVFRRIYTGSWGTSWSEQIVAAAEAQQTVKATALGAYAEAGYLLMALASSTAKTALQARLDAVRPVALFHDAVRLIDVAVASVLQSDKDAAQAALNTASAAEFTGGTAPYTVAAQQARIDAIPIVTVTKTVKVGFGTATATAGWNKTAATALASPLIADLLKDDGGSSGWALNLTNAATGNNANTGLVSAATDFPGAILANCITDSANQIELTVTGLDNARRYDIGAMCARSTSAGKKVIMQVNGGASLGDIDAANNVTTPITATNIAPVGGTITLLFRRGTGSSFVYLNGLVIREHS